MTYLELYKLFTPSTAENFPKDVCTIQNAREPDVYDSKEKYLCLIIDTRFKHDYRVTAMCPYICKTDGKTEFGWVDCLFQCPHTNLENSVRLENEVVVGFKKFSESDRADSEWDGFVQSVENQYEN